MMVTVRQKGKNYTYRFEGAVVNGKRTQVEKGGFNTKKEAYEAGIKAYNEFLACGSHIVISEMSMADYLDSWLIEYSQLNNLKSSTVESYRKKIKNHIKPSLGHYKLKAISHDVLQRFMNELYDKGLSRNTLISIKAILSSCFGYAVVPKKYIPSSPMEHVKLPSDRKRPEVETRSDPHIFISEDQMKKIIERFPTGTPDHIPLMLGYKCGLRLGEAFAITWEDVDLENKTLSINKQVKWKPAAEAKLENLSDSEGFWYFDSPKYNSSRVIDIDDELTELLRKAKEQQERAKEYYGEYYAHYYRTDSTGRINRTSGKEVFFVNVREDGSYIQARTMQHTSSVIHNQIGLKDFDFHSLRVTHCTMLLEEGAPPKYVQERLGHKDIKVTLKTYYRISEKMKLKGNDTLNAMVKGLFPTSA